MIRKFTKVSLKKFKSTIGISSLVLLCNAVGFAQNNDVQWSRLQKDSRVEKVLINSELKTPSLIRLAASSKLKLSDAPAILSEMVKADGNTEFRKIDGVDGSTAFKTSVAAPKEGISTVKFQQYFKGVKVQHGIFNALMNGDKTEAYTGEYYDLKTVSVTATITEKQALDFAMAFVGATKYAWDQAKEARDLEINPLRKQLYNDTYEKLLPKGELVIVKDYDTQNIADLSYKFDIYAGEPMSRAWVYVNAHSGKIMLNDKIIKHLSPDLKDKRKFNGIVPEVAAIMSGSEDAKMNSALPPATNVGDTATVGILTRYVGLRQMGVTAVSGTENDPSGNGATIVNSNGGLPFTLGEKPWVLIDKRFHGVGSNQSEQTYDLNGVGGLPISVPAYGSAKSFTDVDNNWTTAEHKRGGNNEGENDDFAFDAHWGAGIVYQYWKNIHGRLSYDNKNSSIKSYVHSGVAYDNAFWNGSVMTYGDGSFQNGAQAGFAPLVALDVCGHEIGHGVCSNTSNLVYANESGGMNEGYSDIWAACVENYALINVDPTLIASATFPNGFDIWGIGEQIDARDATGTAPNLVNKPTFNGGRALRNMDNPGKENDPSSYAEATKDGGGPEQWTEQAGCTPTLANDQCGVHNNSGVLNHIFYYLVAGSGTVTKFVNTRKALTDSAAGGAAFAAQNGEPYKVDGIGFAKAEKIFYLTEQNLTPNATFHQARNVAMMAAEVLYGKCSFEWKQTILAFHGGAVGRSSDTAVCSNLQVYSAAISKSSISEGTPKSNVNCTDAVQVIDLSVSILSPGLINPITVTITPSGTATNGQDYNLSATTLNFIANETGIKRATISVYNDAEIESTETILLAIHATDGMSFTKDTTMTLTILDDDALPIIGAGRSELLNENFNSTTDYTLPNGWSIIDKIGAASTIEWITSTNASGNGFATKAAFIKLKVAPNAAATPTYAADVSGDVLLITKQIDATGKADLKLNFTYAAGGEPSGSGTSTLDYGKIKYSLDGVNFQTFQFDDREYRLTPQATKDSVFLPTQLNNKKFYLAFEWYNDANVAVPPGFIIDDVVVTGGTQKVETELNQGVSEKQFANKDIFYTSANDGQVIARIQNNSTDLGCVKTFISEAGNGAGASITYNAATYQRAKRVVTITPSTPSTNTTYDLTLYVTAAELTGLTPSSLHILKIKDGTPTSGALSSSDVVEFTPVFGDFNADGYYTYSVNGVTGFSQFVLALNTTVLPQKLLSFNAVAQNNKFVKVTWATTNEGTGNYEVERAEKGTTAFKTIAQKPMQNGNNVNEYSFNDENVVTNIVYQYRLKSTNNNSFSYSAIKLASISGKDFFVDIAPNPSNGMYKIAINGFSGMAQMNVYNVAGQELFTSRKMMDNGSSTDIDLTNQPAGIYTLKIKMNTVTEVYKLIVQ